MASANEIEGNERLHFPHLRSAINLEEVVAPVLRGLYRFRNPNQAITSGHNRQVEHELQFRPTPSSNLFGTTGQWVDLELPTNLHYLERIDVRLDLTNTNTDLSDNDISLATAADFMFERVEVRVGSEIIDTIYDIEEYFDHNVYADRDTMMRMEANTKFDHVTFQPKTDFTIGPTETKTIRFKIRNILTACGIAPALISRPVTLRFYTRRASDVFTGDPQSDVADYLRLDKIRVHARETRGDETTMIRTASPHLDYRYLDSKVDEQSVSLVSGTRRIIQLNNFSQDDLCSHMFVLFRDTAQSGANLGTFAKPVDQIWLENESGVNLHNGIQWRGQELLDVNYKEKFENIATDVHGLYLIYSPAQDPVSDYEKGVMTGSQPLSRNLRLNVIPNATGEYWVTVVVWKYNHVRLAKGEITVR